MSLAAEAQGPSQGAAEGLAVRAQQRSPGSGPPARFVVCPRCTLHNSPSAFECAACGGMLRRRSVRRPTTSSPGGELATMALRAALAGVAGVALGRASAGHGMQRLVLTGLAVAALPIATRVLGSLLGLARGGGAGVGGGRSRRLAGGAARTFADREARRQQLRRAAQSAGDEAAAAGAMSPEEQRLLRMVLAPAGSRAERVRAIAEVLELLRQLEAAPGPRSPSTQLVAALVVHELNALVDEMDYEELYAAFGGHPPTKGLSEDALQALPATKLTAAALPGLHSATCAVCLEAFGEGDTVRALPGCSHCFHAACVDPWLAAKALCPVCRQAVEPPAAGGSAVAAGK